MILFKILELLRLYLFSNISRRIRSLIEVVHSGDEALIRIADKRKEVNSNEEKST
jgi:hypothetical protein